MTVHMVYKGTVTGITETEITFDLDIPYGGDRSAAFEFEPGTRGAGVFAIGDRVAWWPVWDIVITGPTRTGHEGHTRRRLVRIADLPPDELREVDSAIARGLGDERRQAEYAETMRRDARNHGAGIGFAAGDEDL